MAQTSGKELIIVTILRSLAAVNKYTLKFSAQFLVAPPHKSGATYLVTVVSVWIYVCSLVISGITFEIVK